MINHIYKIFSLKQGELKILSLSFAFIFVLFGSYAILRPMRDALGLEGKDELKWLFLATFGATLIVSLLMMLLSSKIKRRFYTDVILIFFALNLVMFYVAMQYIPSESASFLWLCRIFYVWVSIFNLFVFSTAWSLLADIFTKDMSKRLFGIISAGASLGSIAGAASMSIFATDIELQMLVFISVVLLLCGIVLKNMMIREAKAHIALQEDLAQRFERPIDAKNPFIGFKLIITSKYLLALCAFILLLTAVSTFLYMEQARIISVHFATRQERISAFATIDFIVQVSSLCIQFFLTAKIAQFLGIKALLGILGFAISIGFVFLAFSHPAFLPLVIVMSIRRIGEYSLVKPGREMLFVPLDSNAKYKVKNFLDTVVYRGGDALSAQIEAVLAHLSIVCVLLVGALISFVWGLCGVFLGKHYEDNVFT